MNSKKNLSVFQEKIASQIKSVFDCSLSLHNGDKICRRCQKRFCQTEFISHQKNCKRSNGQRDTKSLTLSHYQNISISTLEPDNNNNNNERNIIVQSIMTSVVNFVRTSVIIFVNKNSHLSYKVLLQIMMHKCLDFNNILSGVLKQNDLITIKSNALLSPVVQKLDDVFNVDIIQSRIKHFPKNKQQRIRNKLNKFMKDKSLPELYKKANLIFESQKVSLPLMFAQFRRIIISMLQTKKKNYVHLALDLLIIFHSQQRMPGSIDLLENLIPKILQSNQVYIAIRTAIKTGNKELLTINKELKKMLIEFGWKNFFSKRCLQRLSQNFNFSLISLRKGCYSQIYLHKHKTTIHHLTFHKVEESVNFYLKSVLTAQLVKFHQKLSLLNSNFFQAQIQKILPKMLQPLNGDVSLCQLTFFSQLQKYQIIISNQQKERVSQKDEEQIGGRDLDDVEASITDREQTENDKSENDLDEGVSLIRIMGLEYKVKDGQFIGSIFQNYKIKQAKCIICLKVDCGKICIFCCSKYHQDCLPEFCKCMKFIVPQNQILVSSSVTKSKMHIEMPSQYFKNEKYLKQLRKLINLRGFYFCTSAIPTVSIPVNCQISEIEELHIPQYNQYEAGRYCPPLIFSQSGEQNTFGTGVGLFAADKITAGTFIGEYGGTIVSEDELILLKRKDMSMKFFDKNGIQYYIGADHHCSYIQLVNGSSPKESNCEIIKIVVNGRLKLLLISTKIIQRGTQLLYNYGENYGTQEFQRTLKKNIELKQEEENVIEEKDLHHLAPEEENVIEEKDLHHLAPVEKQTSKQINNKIDAPEAIKKKKNKATRIQRIALQRCQNSCYADSVIVLMKMLTHYIPKNSKKTLVKKLISNKEFNVGKLVDEFEVDKKDIQRNIQQDFDEFFLFLKSKLKIDSPFDDIVLFQQFCCSVCQLKSSKYIYEADFRPHQLQLKLSQEYTIERNCSQCSSLNNVHQVFRKVVSSPHLLILNFSSTFHDGTKRNNIIKVKKILHGKFEYTPKLIVYHHGDQTHRGHFVTLDTDSNFVYDSGKCRNFNPQLDYHVCLIIFQRSPLKEVAYNEIKQLNQCGIFLQVKKKIIMSRNVENYYNIASIVKIITFLASQKLRNKLSLSLAHRFVIPKCSHLNGRMAYLKQSQLITIDQLYHYMLIGSACDAAFTLSIGFGDLLKTKDTQSIKSESLFLDQMKAICFQLKMFNTILQDPCGLKKNVSCISDLLILIELVIKDQKFVSITKINMYQGLQNTNIFCNKLIGKTGTHREGACFLGKNEQHTVALLDVKSHQTLFYYLGIWLKQK